MALAKMPADENSPLCPKKDIPGLETGGLPVGKLQRTIGILSASAIVYGNCVGAGIFISPKGVYEMTGSAGGGLLVWFCAGIIATLCTVAYAELGTMFQESGGEFVYIMKSYGKLPAFVFSFVNSFLIKPASLSVVVLTFGEYLTAMIFNGPNVVMSKTIAASLIILILVLNCVSVKVVLRVCGVISVLKIGLIAFLLVCGAMVAIGGKEHKENFQNAFEGSSKTISDYGLAFYFAVYSYQSWNTLNYMTEELKNPEKTLPIGGVIGITGVTISYVLANISYLMLFSVAYIIQSNTIAMDCGYEAFGNIGKMIMTIGLLVSCVGCVAGGTMAVARNIQSTAEKGLFPTWAAYVSATFHTPVVSLLVVSIMVLFYLLFDVSILIPCIGTAEWFFYAVTFSSLLFMRWKQPNTHRPIKLPLFIPILLLAITCTFVILPLFNHNSRMSVLIGLSFLPLGAALYGLRHLMITYCGRGRDPLTTRGDYESLKDKRCDSESSNDSGFDEYKNRS